MSSDIRLRGAVRDPARSRSAILDAAESLFAARGFDAVSLTDIGSLAGVSRSTPSYFFGSKEDLYLATLQRAFEAREAAARDAFAPLIEWTRTGDATGTLRAALEHAATGYMSFLHRNPAFVRLIQREDLEGGTRLRAAPHNREVLYEPFGALRSVADERGLRPFEPDDAVLLFVSLVFSPMTQRRTFMVALGRDLDDAATRARHVDLVVDQLLSFVAGRRH